MPPRSSAPEVGAAEDDRDLGKLGGLQREGTDGDPARGAVGVGAGEGQKDDGEHEQGARPEEGQQAPDEVVVGNHLDDDGEHDADAHEDELALEVVGGVVAHVVCGERRDGRRRVDHEQTEGGEADHAGGEDEPGGHEARGHAEDRALGTRPVACAGGRDRGTHATHPSGAMRSATRRLKTRPRSSKPENSSKDAQAGESSTVSPASAAAHGTSSGVGQVRRAAPKGAPVPRRPRGRPRSSRPPRRSTPRPCRSRSRRGRGT